MDRKVTTRRKDWQVGAGAVAVLGMAVVMYQTWAANFGTTTKVRRSELRIAEVQRGNFKEYITLTGYIEPSQTVYLDAAEAGIVADIRTEPGAQVRRGDTLLRLTNSDLQLEVMQREAELYEQINNLRRTRLLLNQNDLSQRARLAEIDYQLDLLRPRFQRSRKLHIEGIIADQELETVSESYRYNQQRKTLVYKAYQADSVGRKIQLQQLQASEKRIRRSLTAVQQIMDRLQVTAPIGGQLSALPITKGEAVTPGQRLGQIDRLQQKIIRAQADELYLGRIRSEQPGTAQLHREAYPITVQKIYPTVENGRFRVDFRFADTVPQVGKSGQSLRLRLFMGEGSERLLLPTGNFYSSTGGHWVFVLRGNQAVRQPVELGRRNPRNHEVRRGLKAGDRVIISDYVTFKNYQKLELK